MLASWYVALRHEFPTELPPEVQVLRKQMLFARWLVLTGRLSDWGPFPNGQTVDAAEPLDAPERSRRWRKATARAVAIT